MNFWIGTNQQVTGNTFNFEGNGTRTTGSGARSFGFQNGTTGGTGYDGLLIGTWMPLSMIGYAVGAKFGLSED